MTAILTLLACIALIAAFAGLTYGDIDSDWPGVMAISSLALFLAACFASALVPSA